MAVQGPRNWRPNAFHILGGSILHDEFNQLRRAFQNRYRKNIANYFLGNPYRSYIPSRQTDRSLARMRLTSVRRASTKRRLTRGRYARAKKRTRRVVRSRRARRAMGTNGPAFRTRQRRSRFRADLGQRMGYMPSRRVATTSSTSTSKDKELHTNRLISIPYNDTDNYMNCRTGRLCDVHGVKFRAWFSLKQPLVETSVIWDNPIQVRWAVINPKNNTGQDVDITAGTNWFMSDSPAVDDAADFPVGTATVGANCFRYMNRKINSRRYGVLQEGSFLLSNDPGATNTRVLPRAKKFISFYLPIKRQMKWSGIGTGTEDMFPNANLHFVYWFVKMGDKDDPQSYDSDQPFDFHNERITYFKNAEILT